MFTEAHGPDGFPVIFVALNFCSFDTIRRELFEAMYKRHRPTWAPGARGRSSAVQAAACAAVLHLPTYRFSPSFQHGIATDFATQENITYLTTYFYLFTFSLRISRLGVCFSRLLCILCEGFFARRGGRCCDCDPYLLH